ncbi:MAG: hypothetical protein HYV34_04995 [Candidatus Kerfeldbacteria bacterium]|nr:hypothetical protein [Candidatus Kerfeldbacteria bacterium]
MLVKMDLSQTQYERLLRWLTTDENTWWFYLGGVVVEEHRPLDERRVVKLRTVSGSSELPLGVQIEIQDTIIAEYRRSCLPDGRQVLLYGEGDERIAANFATALTELPPHLVVYEKNMVGTYSPLPVLERMLTAIQPKPSSHPRRLPEERRRSRVVRVRDIPPDNKPRNPQGEMLEH